MMRRNVCQFINLCVIKHYFKWSWNRIICLSNNPHNFGEMSICLRRFLIIIYEIVCCQWKQWIRIIIHQKKARDLLWYYPFSCHNATTKHKIHLIYIYILVQRTLWECVVVCINCEEISCENQLIRILVRKKKYLNKFH